MGSGGGLRGEEVEGTGIGRTVGEGKARGRGRR